MTKYILKKILQILVVLILLSVIVFVLARLCPGDPLQSYYGDSIERMSEAEKDAARERLGLDDSLIVQYGRWLQGLFSGDLGISYKYKQPVTTFIGKMWATSLILGGTAYLLTFGLAVMLGLFCASREGSFMDRTICKIGVVSNNIPSFFLALILIYIFAVCLKILPVSGAYSYGNSGNVLDRIVHLILPVSVLVLEHLWYYAYMVRNKLLEETRKDYVLLCKAEGLSRRRILWICCLKNIMPSLLVMMAISLPHILGGTYVVESVFSYPGLGTLCFESAMYKDYNMLMALCMLTGIVVVIFNILAQIINETLDPRMRYERGLDR